MLPRTLGDHIRRRRIDLKLLQKEVGQHMGVHCLSVWNWERNRTEPELKHQPAIIAFLGYDPLPLPTTLAERLVQHRRSRGWSQKRLAAELDVDPTTLARWERGEKTPWGPYVVRVKALVG
ncbi:MAG: helix-turn-helix domain-containing protein [Opitutus sp.]|nr:helix-turn-helix domain-containing protein [Opitutus sp.]